MIVIFPRVPKSRRLGKEREAKDDTKDGKSEFNDGSNEVSLSLFLVQSLSLVRCIVSYSQLYCGFCYGQISIMAQSQNIGGILGLNQRIKMRLPTSVFATKQL